MSSTRSAGLAAAISLLLASGFAASCGSFGGDSGTGAPPPGSNPDDGGPGPITGEPNRGLEVTVGDPKATAFLMQGGSLTLAVKLTRKEASTRAVAITVSKLPKGVTADALELPAGAVDGALTLHAAPSPATGQGPAVLEIAAVEIGDRGAGATTTLSTFVRGTRGALDTTFGGVGALLHPYGTITETKAVDAKVLSAGAILVGFRRVNNTALSRFTAAGVLDTTFAGGGATNLAVSQSSVLVDAYEPAAPGKGFIWVLETGAQSPGLFHLNLDGSVDAGFPGGGRVTVDDGLAGPSQGSQVVALSDGKALVLASHPITTITTVTRWNADGTRDDTYGTGGSCQLSGTAARMVLRSGGAVLVSVAKAAGGGAVQGCTAAGIPETALGSPPKSSVDVGPEVVDLARTPDGGLAFLSNVTTGPGAPYATWSRVSSSFVGDTGIGMFGTVKTTLATATTFVVQADGGLLIGGAAGPELIVVRYTSKGVPDPDFGTGGTARFDVAGTGDAEMVKLVAQPDGRILALGKHYDTVDAAIVRFWP